MMGIYNLIENISVPRTKPEQLIPRKAVEKGFISCFQTGIGPSSILESYSEDTNYSNCCSSLNIGVLFF